MRMASRRALGPVNHLATAAAVFRRKLEVDTELSAADGRTKALSGPALPRHMEAMGYERREAKTQVALEVALAAAAWA